MNRYAKLLTNSPSKSLLLLIVIVGTMVYLIPWIVTPALSTTLGGWDLAEWISLHPAVRFADPNLTASLYLRLPPVLLILIFALNIPYPRFTRGWFVALGIVISGAIFLAPPPEFLNDTGDVNYRQQLTLSAVTLIGGIIGLSGLLAMIRMPLTLLLSGAGVFVSLGGLEYAHSLLSGLRLPVEIGFGGLLSAGIFMLLIFAALIPLWRREIRKTA